MAAGSTPFNTNPSLDTNDEENSDGVYDDGTVYEIPIFVAPANDDTEEEE